MTPKQKRAMRKGQMLMKRATPAMRAKWARKATATRASKRMRGSNPVLWAFDEEAQKSKKLGWYDTLDLQSTPRHRTYVGVENQNGQLESFNDVKSVTVFDRPIERNPQFRSFLGGGSSRGGISAGDSVVIRTPQGSTLRGRAVMPSSSGGWVINLGGRFGTPAVADEENIVSIRKKKSNPELMILSNPGKKRRRKCGTKRRKSSSRRRRSRRGKKPVKIFLKKRKGAKLKYKGKTVSLKSLINRLGKLGAGKYLKRSGKGSYRVKQIGYKKK